MVLSPQQLQSFQARRRAVLAGLIATLLVGLFFVSAQTAAHEGVETLGFAMLFAAIAGRVWCTLFIGGRKASEIVRDGPYSMMRNPLYFFSTLGAFGVGAMSGSVIIACLLALFCYLAFLVVIRFEERYLAQHFGQSYLDYRRGVPRFFPDPRLFHQSSEIVVSPKLVYRSFTDSLVFLVAWPILEGIEALQRADLLPVFVHLF